MQKGRSIIQLYLHTNKASICVNTCAKEAVQGGSWICNSSELDTGWSALVWFTNIL